MRATGATILLFGLFCCALPAQPRSARAEFDANEDLQCGTGAGAARVIDGTQSPNKQLAVAWRLPDAEPAEQPDDDDQIELLLVRLRDGAILGKSYTGFRANARCRSNNKLEEITWSRNGRLAARLFQTQFETDSFELFALGAKGELAGQVDLHKIVEPAMPRASRDTCLRPMAILSRSMAASF